MRIRDQVMQVKKRGDIVIASVHWRPNWGYDIPIQESRFSHGLVDEAGVDVVHGHSSHHVMAIEVYHGKLILYGCGDFLNDYECISGYEAFRGDLGLMYFARIVPETGNLLSLEMAPTRVLQFRVHYALAADAAWITNIINREKKKYGIGVDLMNDNRLQLKWK